jgi:Ca-activated chloride channel family protein
MARRGMKKLGSRIGAALLLCGLFVAAACSTGESAAKVGQPKPGASASSSAAWSFRDASDGTAKASEAPTSQPADMNLVVLDAKTEKEAKELERVARQSDPATARNAMGAKDADEWGEPYPALRRVTGVEAPVPPTKPAGGEAAPAPSIDGTKSKNADELRKLGTDTRGKVRYREEAKKAGTTRVGSAGADGGELGREPNADPGRRGKADPAQDDQDGTPDPLTTELNKIYDAKQGELWAKPVLHEDRTLSRATAFPLKHTNVASELTGYVSTTRVTQKYGNDFDQAIEAVYVFPLPTDSAVNGFRMVIGERVIMGLVRRRAEAREIYESAKRQGYTASLLEQERPNIFTQSIANIAPKAEVSVEIAYVNRLKRNRGTYEYSFPMVVGPRYGGHTPDIAKITPPVVPAGMRNGHDISLSVSIDAGLPARNVICPSHDVILSQGSDGRSTVTLSPKDNVPNRDFVLRYEVTGSEYQTGVVTHAADGRGFISMMFTPPTNPNDVDVSPREITFVLDISGSMSGTPMDLSKRLVNRALDKMRFNDQFNIFFFAGGNGQLWESPRPNNAENVTAAKDYLSRLQAGGGTEMLAGLRRLFNSPKPANALRMVVFLTDGYVGNEEQIISAVKQNSEGSRFYIFGVGSSVNHHLVEGIGKHGRGHAVTLLPRENDAAEKAADEFFSHIDAPVLTDISVDWGNLPVKEAYPARIPDVFAGHPVNLVARYDATQRLSGVAKLRARKGGVPVEFPIQVELPAVRAENSAIAAVWARAKIEELTDARLGAGKADFEVLTNQITEVALASGLVSEGTSFVAVDDWQKTGNGAPRRIDVPAEQPEGVSREHTRGGEGGKPAPAPAPERRTRDAAE